MIGTITIRLKDGTVYEQHRVGEAEKVIDFLNSGEVNRISLANLGVSFPLSEVESVSVTGVKTVGRLWRREDDDADDVAVWEND